MPTAYKVLARKYRPEVFADLVGQEAMVRTLRNAFETGRIAHAFILTGVRGVGKTTTARIVAKGLNCTAQDGPTVTPCGECAACVAISEGRHVDVQEMDAASRTGVGDIREITDSVAYRAASARYKVYIIDEVHMLSTSAFNALLKTLEEPPEHVKFIFATTEIRKVPVTILSRCQRFDLRRIEPEEMLALLRRIADAEGARISDEALALVTRAAEGSARDAISLLDQAIAHGAGETEAGHVRDMLGLADRGRVLDLFEFIARGDPRGALDELSAQYSAGADPIAVLRDLAEVTHWISMVRITPEAADDPTIGPDERSRGLKFATALDMRALTRMWQMLLKALDEVAAAPNAMMAAEMAVIRLTHAADLPSPEDLVRRLQDSNGPGSGTGGGAVPPHPGGHAPSAMRRRAGAGGSTLQVDGAAPLAEYATFADVVALVRTQRDIAFLREIETGICLAGYAPGRIEFVPSPDAAPDLAARLGQKLRQWTGVRWAISIVNDGGAPTLAARQAAEERDMRAQAERCPLVIAALDVFPGARIGDVRQMGAEAAPEDTAAAEEDWDPFSEET